MPLKPHPTDEDKVVYVKPEYLIDGWKKPWVGLTEKEREEIAVIAQYDPLRMTVYEYRVAIQIATEAKLKEKNT